MAITLSAGTPVAGTTSAAPAYPAGVAAGAVAVLKVVSKLSATTITTPATYTQLVQVAGGDGSADGADGGNVRACIFYLELAGTESGTVTVGSGLNVVQAVIDIYTADNGFNTGSFAATSGADATFGTAWSATMGATLGFTTGDVLIGVNGLRASTSTQASKAVSATGATFGTLANDRAVHTASGNDLNFGTFDFPVTAGPATAAAVHTMTTSVSNAGITAIARLVEAAPPAVTGTIAVTQGDDVSAIDGTVTGLAVPPVVPMMATMAAP